MKIDVKNDIKKEEMVITASVSRRKYTSQERETFQWKDVQKLLQNYVPPKGYILGKCRKRNNIADNCSDDRLEAKWVFKLLKKITKRPTPNTTTSARPKRRKTRSRSKDLTDIGEV